MKRYHKVLILIFLLTLAFRLYFAFQTPYYSSDDSYFNVRNTEYIQENFSPIFYDELSYGGRYILASPIFHYFLAFFDMFLPAFVAFKIIPEILLACLVIIIFVIAKTITNNNVAALLSALIAGFVPIFVSNTINQISVYSLVFILLFYSIYALLNIKTHLPYFVALSFILPILHPFGFILSISLLLYVTLLSLESMRVSQLVKEAVMLSIFVGILINLIMFKKAFLSFGLLAVWQNLPTELLVNFFGDVNVLDLISGLGVVPLIFGIMGFFFGIFKERKNVILLLSAMILTMFILLFLRLIDFGLGAMFLGILLSIMSALAFDKISVYIKMTKFSKYKKVILVSFLIIIATTLVLPAYSRAKSVISDSLSEDEVEALTWISENTAEDSTIFASIEEGNYITAIAKRKNVADTHFLLAQDRYSDVSTAFTTESLVIATQLLDKYDVDYIYLSERAKANYGINNLKYVGDENCFKEVYKTERTRIYKVLC